MPPPFATTVVSRAIDLILQVCHRIRAALGYTVDGKLSDVRMQGLCPAGGGSERKGRRIRPTREELAKTVNNIHKKSTTPAAR